MSSNILLDTPKRSSLQSRADTIRAALKDFERSFAAEQGKKPGKEDIKANEDVSRNYKEYNKLRDVLAGKCGLSALEDGSPKHKRRYKPAAEERNRGGLDQTPKAQRVLQQDVYIDGDDFELEEGVQLTAIGPTPQRDGMVLGLFDMMSNPGSGRHLGSGGMNTPGNRKRKVDVLNTHDKGEEALVAATPEQNRRKQGGDLLDFLSAATPATGRAKHSRTPISEGRKFMLNQFFATPSAVRYLQMAGTESTPQKDELQVGKTPLKSHVLGLTPTTKRIVNGEKDKTPNYLKRSHSFKDRLLSASTTSAPVSKRNSLDALLSPASLRSGPSTFRSKARYQPKPLSQIAAEMKQRDQEQRNVEGDDEDGMDALRDLEDAELDAQPEAGEDAEREPTRMYKKKGQKRTTRRVIMRPQPKLQQADPAEDRVEETQLQNAPDVVVEDDWSDDELFEALAADENKKGDEKNDSDDDDFNEAATPEKKRKAMKNSRKEEKALGKPSKSARASKGDGAEDKPRKYNPNATAHMNFKTLKIKNKNSKGKSGGRGGRFGGRRR